MIKKQERMRAEGAKEHATPACMRVPSKSKFEIWLVSIYGTSLGVRAPSLKLAACTVVCIASQGMAKRSSELEDVLPYSKWARLESMELQFNQKAMPRED